MFGSICWGICSSFPASLTRGRLLAMGRIAIGLILAACATWSWQGWRWLKTGAIPRVPFQGLLDQAGLHMAPTGWVGVDRIISAALDLPLSWLCFFGGLLMAGAYFRNEDRYQRRQRRHMGHEP